MRSESCNAEPTGLTSCLNFHGTSASQGDSFERLLLSRLWKHFAAVHTASMDNLDTSSGGPSPKRQRTQVADGQDSVPFSRSQGDRAENGTERPAATDAAHEAEPEEGPQLSESLDNLTETVKAGMFMIHSRTQAADAKVV